MSTDRVAPKRKGRGPTSFPLVLFVSACTDGGQAVVQIAMFFISSNFYNFSEMENFLLGLVWGILAFPAPLVIHWTLKRVAGKVYTRTVCILVGLTLGTLPLIPFISAMISPPPSGGWTLWVLTATFGFTVALMWPPMESFVSADRPPDHLFRYVSAFAMTWSTAVMVAFLVFGVVTQYAPNYIFLVTSLIHYASVTCMFFFNKEPGAEAAAATVDRDTSAAVSTVPTVSATPATTALEEMHLLDSPSPIASPTTSVLLSTTPTPVPADDPTPPPAAEQPNAEASTTAQTQDVQRSAGEAPSEVAEAVPSGASTPPSVVAVLDATSDRTVTPTASVVVTESPPQSPVPCAESDPETGTASGTSSSTAVATCASGKPLPAETVVLQKRVRLLRLVRWMLPMNTILLSTLQPFLPFGEAAIGVSATMQAYVTVAWMVARPLTFLAMATFKGWRDRWVTPVVASTGLVVFFLFCYGASVIAPSKAGELSIGGLAVFLVGLFGFGTSWAIIYNCGLYYSQVVLAAEVKAGALFEFILGFGYVFGPLIGLIPSLFSDVAGVFPKAWNNTATMVIALFVMLVLLAVSYGTLLQRPPAAPSSKESTPGVGIAPEKATVVEPNEAPTRA